MHPYRTSDAPSEIGFIDDREEATTPWDESTPFDESTPWGETNEMGVGSEGGAESGSGEETPSKKRKRHLDSLAASRAAKRQKK